MGFELPERTALLQFEDGEYAGAEVRCRLNVGMGVMFDLWRLQNSPTPDDIQRAFLLFADEALIEWNLTRRGEAIPASPEGLGRVPMEFIRLLLAKWQEAAIGVPDPLDSRSANGATSRAGTKRTAHR